MLYPSSTGYKVQWRTEIILKIYALFPTNHAACVLKLVAVYEALYIRIAIVELIAKILLKYF